MNPLTRGRTTRTGARADRRFSFLTAAIVWAMIIMMILPGNLDFGGPMAGSAEGNVVTRTLWLVIMGIAIVVVAVRMPLVLQVLRRTNVFFLLFIGLAAASMFWSIDSELTFRSLVRMWIVCGAALAVAVAGWNRRRFQELVRPALTLMLFGSLVFGIAYPDLAIHQEVFVELKGAWHGLFPTKNGLGAMSSVCFILWVHAWLSKEARRGPALLGALISATCLILSRSSTSLMATVLTVLALLLLMRTPGSMRRSVPYLATGLLILILVYSLAMLKVVPGLEVLLAPIPMITGKDLTFSNRADIWAAVVNHVRYRPLLGSGYAAYFIQALPTPNLEAHALLGQLQGFYPGSAHNGYLQILNDLGAVGLAVLFGYLIVYFRQSMKLYSYDRSQGALFVGLFLQQATINLTEPLWLNVLIVDFVLMALATTCLARALVEVKARSAQPSAQPGVRRVQRVGPAGAARPYGVSRTAGPMQPPMRPASRNGRVG